MDGCWISGRLDVCVQDWVDGERKSCGMLIDLYELILLSYSAILCVSTFQN